MTPPIWGNYDNSKFQFDFQSSVSDTSYMPISNNFLGSLFLVQPNSGSFLGNWNINIPSSLNFMNFFNLYQKFGSNSGFGNIGGFLNGMLSGSGGVNYSFGTGLNPSFTLNSGSKAASAESKDNATPQENKLHNNLKSILDSYAEWYENKYGDNDIKDEIAEIEKSDTTAEKTQKLRELYNTYKSDITDFLTKNLEDEKVPLNNEMTIKLALQDLGIEETDDCKTFAENLIDDIENVSAESEINLTKALNGNTLINVISCYNTTQKNFIGELCEKDLSKPVVKTLLEELIKQLVSEAKAQCKNLKTDNKFYETLEGMQINANTNTETLQNEFNKVYAYTRMLASRAADSMFTRYYGIETTMFSDKAKADLKKENSRNEDNVEAAEELELKPNAYIGKPPAVTAAKKVKEKEAEGKAKETLEEMAQGNLLIKGTEKIKIGESDYDTYTEAFGSEKKTYIAVGGEIHTVTKENNTWTDTGKVENWQENINKKLINAQIETDKKAEENKTKEENAGIQQSEFNLVKTKTGKDTEKYGKITINDKEYNVFKSGNDFYIVKKKVINEVYKLPSNKIEEIEGKKEIRLKSNSEITETELIKYKSIDKDLATKANKMLTQPWGWKQEQNYNDFKDIVETQINSENVLDFINAYNEYKGKNNYVLFSQLFIRCPLDKNNSYLVFSKLLSYLMEFISNLDQDIENCGKKAKVRNCYNKLVENTKEYTLDTPNNIQAIIDELNEILK